MFTQLHTLGRSRWQVLTREHTHTQNSSYMGCWNSSKQSLIWWVILPVLYLSMYMIKKFPPPYCNLSELQVLHTGVFTVQSEVVNRIKWLKEPSTEAYFPGAWIWLVGLAADSRINSHLSLSLPQIVPCIAHKQVKSVLVFAVHLSTMLCMNNKWKYFPRVSFQPCNYQTFKETCKWILLCLWVSYPH